eukprot:1159881-Pelagomonas_calceolata.AAC.9
MHPFSCLMIETKRQAPCCLSGSAVIASAELSCVALCCGLHRKGAAIPSVELKYVALVVACFSLPALASIMKNSVPRRIVVQDVTDWIGGRLVLTLKFYLGCKATSVAARQQLCQVAAKQHAHHKLVSTLALAGRTASRPLVWSTSAHPLLLLNPLSTNPSVRWPSGGVESSDPRKRRTNS